MLELQTLVLAPELSGEGREAKAAVEAEVTPKPECAHQRFWIRSAEEVLIMAVIQLNVGIKGVVHKDLGCRKSRFSHISSDLFSYTPPCPAFVFNVG